MLLYYIVNTIKNMPQRKTNKRNMRKNNKTQKQRKQRKQQNGGMTGILNTALVPFGILALQKYSQGKVMKRRTSKKSRKSRRRQSKK